MKEHKCWTCLNAGHCQKPIEGWCADYHYNNYDKHWTWTVRECPEYIYDGECVNCSCNINKERTCRYDYCPSFIKGKIGRCSEENWKRKWERKHGVLFVEAE